MNNVPKAYLLPEAEWQPFAQRFEPQIAYHLKFPNGSWSASLGGQPDFSTGNMEFSVDQDASGTKLLVSLPKERSALQLYSLSHSLKKLGWQSVATIPGFITFKQVQHGPTQPMKIIGSFISLLKLAGVQPRETWV